MKICSSCGHQNSGNAMFCENCGNRLPQEVDAAQNGLMGNHNVIAGDVSNTINNTTTHIHHNDSHTTVTCQVCGKLLSKGSGQVYLCGKCRNYVCADHIDREQHMCHTCAEQEKQSKIRKEIERSLAPFDYQRLGNGKYVITQLLDSSAMDVTVPVGVESIGAEAFAGSRILRISLPDGLIAIEKGAFRECRLLKQIHIPSSVLYIGNEAFYNCEKLEISLPAGADLGEHVIFGTLTQHQEEARKIAAEAERQKRLQEEARRRQEEEARRKEVLRKAEEAARAKAEAERRLREEVARRKAEAEAMLQAERARQQSIADEARQKKEAHEKMLADAARHFDSKNGVLEKFHSKTESYTVPSFITAIAPKAFANCQTIKNLILPNSLTTIGSEAFSGCTRLENITLPASLTEIEDDLFYNCSALRSVRIPASVTRIGEQAFENCKQLSSIAVPAAVAEIGNHAFRNCEKLEKITLPSAVQEQKKEVQSWGSYREVAVPYLGVGTFQNCISLQEITLPRGLSEVRHSLFRGCTELRQVTIPDTVGAIGESAFYQCEKLTAVHLPKGIRMIEADTFYDCVSLTRVTLNASPHTISRRAFEGCVNLTAIGNPQNPTMPVCTGYIYDRAFANCGKLERIYVDESAARMNGKSNHNGTLIIDHAFLNCNNLTIVCNGKLAGFLKIQGKRIGGRKLVCKDRTCDLEPNSERIEKKGKAATAQVVRILGYLVLALYCAATTCSLFCGTVVDWICGGILTAIWVFCLLFINKKSEETKKLITWIAYLLPLTNSLLLIIFPQAYRFAGIIPAAALAFFACAVCVLLMKDANTFEPEQPVIFAFCGAAIALTIAPIAGIISILNNLLYMLGAAALELIIWSVMWLTAPKKRHSRRMGSNGRKNVYMSLVILGPVLLYLGLAAIFHSFLPFFLR